MTNTKRIELLERDRAQQSRVLSVLVDASKSFTPEQLARLRAIMTDVLGDAGLRIDAAEQQDEARRDFTATLVIAGYNDSRVQYWEAAKWVAKLRATKTDTNPLLLKTELGAGHGGMSGRYQGLRDVALEYAFVFKVLGIA